MVTDAVSNQDGMQCVTYQGKTAPRSHLDSFVAVTLESLRSSFCMARERAGASACTVGYTPAYTWCGGRGGCLGDRPYWSIA